MIQTSVIANQKNNQNSSNLLFKQDKRSLFFSPPIQPKHAINQSNDVYEQEADVVADKVLQMNNHIAAGNNFFFKPAITSIQRKCTHCEEEEKVLQRKEMHAVTPTASPENYINSISGGSPLNEAERRFFGSRMGYDFSNVRVHTDTAASQSAQSINALAYTSGNNIVFSSGQYTPGTESGKRLLGHELTHVVQQNFANPATYIQRQPVPASFNPPVELDLDAQRRQMQLEQLLTQITAATQHSVELRSQLEALAQTSSAQRDTLTTELDQTRGSLLQLLQQRILLLQTEIGALNRRIGPNPTSSPDNPEPERLAFELIHREQELQSHQHQLAPLLRWQTRQQIENINERIRAIDARLASMPQVSSPDQPLAEQLFWEREDLLREKRQLVASLTTSATEYKQFDQRWGAIRYGTSRSCTNLQEAGCGPTSLAMVLNYLYMEDPEVLADSGQIEFVTPPQTATYAATHGRVCNNGTSGDTMVTNVSTQWPGFTGSSISLEEATAQVREGNLVIFLCHNCTGRRANGGNRSYGGHFMVLSGVNVQGTVFNVLDSGSNEVHDIETITVEELRSHVSGFWTVQRK